MSADAGAVPAPGSDAAELPYRWWVCLGHAAYYTDAPPVGCPICGEQIKPENFVIQLALDPLDNLTMRPRTGAGGAHAE